MSKVFVNSVGREIKLAPVPQMLVEKVRDAAMRSVDVPPAPTYEVQIGDGEGTATYYHDATSVQTPEEKAAWDAYQAALARQNQAAATRVMNFYYTRGIAEEMDGGWEAEQRYFGVEIPEDPIERKLHWIQTELLVSPVDFQEAIVAIMEASGVDEEATRAARSSFRSNARGEADTAGRADRAARAKEKGK